MIEISGQTYILFYLLILTGSKLNSVDSHYVQERHCWIAQPTDVLNAGNMHECYRGNIESHELVL